MTLTPFPVKQFGGLNLTAEPDEVGPGGAIDLLNVDFDKHGAVRTRDGYVKFNSVALGAAPQTGITFARSSGATQVLAGTGGGTIYALSSSGTLVATSGAASSSQKFTRWGSPTAEYVYAAASGGTITRWDGTTFTNPAGVPTARAIGVQPTDNRLVVGDIITGGFRSRVRFSDAGAPETFGANNFVDLTPGDGEVIGAIVPWGNLLFVFKQSRFFVFYGNSIDGTGNPVFNYRTVEMPGVASLADASIAAGHDGIYMFDVTGAVYRARGIAVPEEVSGPVGPYLRGLSTPFFASSGYDWSAGTWWGGYANGRYYLSLTNLAAKGVTLVYDEPTEGWLFWDIATRGVAAGPRPGAGAPDARAPSLFFGISGTNYVYSSSSTAVTDDGTAITGRYRSGFYTVGNQPSQEAVIRESLINGQGTPTFSVSRDFGSVPNNGGGARASVTLGLANLVPYPSFEIDTTGWQLGPGGIGHASAATSLTRVTTIASYGSSSLQVVNPATANVGIETTPAFPTTFASGTTYSIRFDAYSAAGAGALRARIIAVGSLDSAQVDFTPTATWQTFSFQWTPSGNRSDVFLQFYTPGGTAGTWDLDGVMIVQSSTVPSRFFDGSQGTAQGRHRVSQKGRLFSYQIEGAAPWRVDSIVQNVRGVRPSGVRST